MATGGHSAKYRCDVVLEQTLGHVTHGQNLERLLSDSDVIDPTFVKVDYAVDGWERHVPGFGNWTVRAGYRARRGLVALGRAHQRDALFVHTQVPAILLGRRLRDVPTVVSLDATPRQYDELGEHYAHRTAGARVERAKWWLNARCFRRAAHLVTWADWTKASLVDDYGVDGDRVTVIPPGVDTTRWIREPGDGVADGTVRILFVGGDLRRKGGDVLIDAFAPLRERFGTAVELHLVTPTQVETTDGVTVHAGLTPNSAELIELYHRSDIFCLPTRGDCLPMVLPEAGAAGLALVSTDVGAIREIVRDGDTGLLVPPGETEPLRHALERLLTDDRLRAGLAQRAHRLVLADHDATVNAGRIAEVICDAASGRLPGQDGASGTRSD